MIVTLVEIDPQFRVDGNAYQAHLWQFEEGKGHLKCALGMTPEEALQKLDRIAPTDAAGDAADEYRRANGLPVAERGKAP